MGRTSIFKNVLKLLGLAIVSIMLATVIVFCLDIPSWHAAADFASPEEVSSIREYREELRDYIYALRNEITLKETELNDLDKELRRLETSYDQLMEESARIAEEINSLMQTDSNIENN